MRRIVCAILAAGSIAWADRVILTDGSRLEGKLQKQDDGWMVTGLDGKTTLVPAARVLKVELTGSPNAAAADRLASLKRAVEQQTNPDEVIARYQNFIASNPGTDAVAEAQGEIDVWRDRKDRGLSKLGSRWVTTDERAQLNSQIAPQIELAKTQLRSGQLKDAESTVNQIIELDPKNIAGLYLSGLIAFDNEKLPAARKAFESVNGVISGHAPTLNNLAIVNFKQNQPVVALNFLDQAMQATPADRTIVDNTAEILQMLKDDARRAQIARKVEKRFAEQDAILSIEMQKQGLFRWGATFVNQKEFDSLVSAEKAIKEKAAQMQADFDVLVAKTDSLERQIRDGEDSLRRMEADTLYIGPDGNTYRRGLPSYYYDQQKQLRDMSAELAKAKAQQKTMRQQAERVKQDLPTPKYTGILKLIREEGTPIDAPTTQPSTTQPG